MNEALFLKLTYGWIIVGIIVFSVLLFISAPYGRHSKRNWGPMISNKAGWVLMELSSLVMFILYFFSGEEPIHTVTWFIFLLWVLHYTNRSLIYPFRTKTKGKYMPILIMIFALLFNFINASLNGYYLANFAEKYSIDWLWDVRFILGLILFITGVLINQGADYYLLSLRTGSGKGYMIPEHRLFKYVSCPNFSGEILEWIGFALIVWNPAGLAFALWTIFNLVPRAIDHHKWYRTEFADYPMERKAVIPFLV